MTTETSKYLKAAEEFIAALKDKDFEKAISISESLEESDKLDTAKLILALSEKEGEEFNKEFFEILSILKEEVNKVKESAVVESESTSEESPAEEEVK